MAKEFDMSTFDEGIIGAYKRHLVIHSRTKKMDYHLFRKISIRLFNEILKRAIETGSSFWMPVGEIKVIRKHQRRSHHVAYFGNDKIKKIIPILDDYFYRVIWVGKQYRNKKYTSRGVKLLVKKQYKKLIKETVAKKGEDFYELNEK